MRNTTPGPVWPSELDRLYELIGELGQGGMAVVFHARERALGREVAIKTLPPGLAADREAVARLTREARTIAQLDHPNIVQLHTLYHLADGRIALVMQYVPGRNLRETIDARGPLSPGEVHTILRDVARALAHAHRFGVIHRDVKPKNIFIDTDADRAMLSDFGIARVFDVAGELTATGMTIGTPAYMAPEQIHGNVLDGRADLYALGIVGWEMLTGEHPWAGETVYNVIYRQMHDRLPAVDEFRSDVPEQLLYVLDGMLAKSPDRRWVTADRVVALLDDPDPPGLEDWRQARRPKGGLTAYRQRRQAGASPFTAVMETIRFRRPSAPASSSPTSTPVVPPAPASPPQSPEPTSAPAAATPVAGSPPRPTPGTPLTAPAGGHVATPPAGHMAAPPSGHADAPLGGHVATPPRGDVAAPPRGHMASPPRGHMASPPRGHMAAPPHERTSAPRGAQLAAPQEPRSDDRLEASPRDAMDSPVDVPLHAPPRERLHPPPDVPLDARPSAAFNAEATAAPSTPPHADLPVAPTRRPQSPPAATDTGSVAPALGARGLAPEPARDQPPARPPAPLAPAIVERPVARLPTDPTPVWRTSPASLAATPPERVERTVAAPEALTEPVSGPWRTTRSREWAAVVVFVVISAASLLLALGASRPPMGPRALGRGAPPLAGDATTSMRPSRAAGGSGATARVPDDPLVVEPRRRIASGGKHSCVLSDQGRAACWGSNAGGQLGDGGLTSRPLMSWVAATASFADIAAGGAHTCAVATDGAAWCWGENTAGQIGDGTTTPRATPVQVRSSATFLVVGAGERHTCGLTADGAIACWGANNRGQLGDGSFTSRSTPRLLRLPDPAVSLAVGARHTCAITQDGEAYCWGSNADGELGDGTFRDRSAPVRVPIADRITGMSAGARHTCAVTAGGDVRCWGRNDNGQVGIGSFAPLVATPQVVHARQRFVAITAGAGHSCALAQDGFVWCWGANGYGQLGDGSTIDRSRPVPVRVVFPLVSVVAGERHTCGLRSDDVAYCWGGNTDGQAGALETGSALAPVVVR